MSELPSLNIALSVIEELQKENAELKARIKELERALRPFAMFSCSDKGMCGCNNCIARDLIAKGENNEY